jgi:putative tricarboxylic transport membrane protein
MAKKDLISGVFFSVLGGFVIFGAVKHPIWDRYGPGPGFFPLVLGVVFVLLCGILMFKIAADYFGHHRELRKELESAAFASKTRLALCLAFFLCFYWLFESLGFLIMAFGYLFTTLFFLGKRSVKTSLAVSGATALCIYFAFVYALSVQLPLGILRDFILACSSG